MVRLDWRMSDSQLTHVNSLWASDAIWWHRSGSTLVQVKARCLTAQRHYLNQCQLVISEVQWHSYEGEKISRLSITKFSLEITYLRFHPNVPGTNELNLCPPEIAFSPMTVASETWHPKRSHWFPDLHNSVFSIIFCWTHWHSDKMVTIFEVTISNEFSWMKNIIWFKFQ